MKLKRRVHIFVSGAVQGVFFRQSAKEKADALDIVGSAKNLPDGRVEIIAEGEEDKLEEFIKWARTGPPQATVTECETKYEIASGEFKSFEIE